MAKHNIRLGSVLVNIDIEAHYLETVFPDGAKLPAVPHDTDEYRQRAHDLGYDFDDWSMCLEHEILHTVWAQMQGKPYSMALYRAATGEQYTDDDNREEREVLQLQGAINGMRRLARQIGYGHPASWMPCGVFRATPPELDMYTQKA